MSENKGERESLIKKISNNHNNEIGFLTAIYISRERYERKKAREREVAGTCTEFDLTKYQFQLVSLYSDSQMFGAEFPNLHHKNVWLTRP